MRRAFNLVKHLRDVVQIEPGPPAPQVADFNLEGLPRPRRGRGGQTSAKRLVDDRAERPPSPSRERLQLGGDVVIQRQGGSHILMLTVKHHDVKGANPRRALYCVVSAWKVTWTPNVTPELSKPH